MRMIQAIATAAILGGSMVLTYAQTTQPVKPASEVLDNMLKPTAGPGVKPLKPMDTPPAADKSSGAAAVAPGAPQLTVLREGSYVVDRIGRLSKAKDAPGWEFTFESDGQALKDPPLVVLPNLKLMLMEDQLKDTSRDLKFRVTGLITEYRGRNHVLLEKVVVVSE